MGLLLNVNHHFKNKPEKETLHKLFINLLNVMYVVTIECIWHREDECDLLKNNLPNCTCTTYKYSSGVQLFIFPHQWLQCLNDSQESYLKRKSHLERVTS